MMYYLAPSSANCGNGSPAVQWLLTTTSHICLRRTRFSIFSWLVLFNASRRRQIVVLPLLWERWCVHRATSSHEGTSRWYCVFWSIIPCRYFITGYDNRRFISPMMIWPNHVSVGVLFVRPFRPTIIRPYHQEIGRSQITTHNDICMPDWWLYQIIHHRTAYLRRKYQTRVNWWVRRTHSGFERRCTTFIWRTIGGVKWKKRLKAHNWAHRKHHREHARLSIQWWVQNRSQTVLIMGEIVHAWTDWWRRKVHPW